MVDYIRYIEKTHEYYRSQGYHKTYNYAYNEDIPFVRRKDLMIDEEARDELFSLGVRSAPAMSVRSHIVPFQ